MQDISLAELIEEAQKKIVGQEKVVEQVCVTLYKHLIKMAAQQHGVHLRPMNTLLLYGNSGTGKTHTVKTVCNIIELPFMDINSKEICLEGWHGQTLREIIYNLLPTEEKHYPYSVIFLDEIDKLIVENSSSKYDNMSLHLQSSILKIIEGMVISNMSTGSQRKKTEEFFLDTANFCFILAGSFASLSQKKKDQIGFSKKDEEEILPTTQSLINFGMIPELAGRITSFAKTNDFTKDTYFRLLENQESTFNKWKNCVINMGLVKDCFFNEKIKNKIVNYAMDVKLGARGLNQACDEYLSDSILENKKNLRVRPFFKKW